MLPILLALLSLAHAGRRHQRKQQLDASSYAFDVELESLAMLEKGYAVEKALYWPKCVDSPLFGHCDLRDFEVATNNVLGSGGYGKVFLGKHKPTGKTVALKQIAWDVVNPKHVEHEETIHHKLKHPYIAQFHCTMRDTAGNLFFAIEYIPGNNLGRRISGRKEKLARSTVQRYIAEIVVALQYLHEQCIVYRDLKASNILVSPKDHIKLIDFGLSVYDCDDRLRGFAGTLEYAAPEMAAHKNYGRAVDYYSLGILLFRLVTGRLPLSRTQVNMEKPEFLALVARGFDFPSTGDRIADDLIAHFCDRNTANRYGVNKATHRLIREHPFFAGFSWSSLKSMKEQDEAFVDWKSSASRTMITLDRLHELELSESDSY